MSEAGKGSKQRPSDKKKFDESFDRIFGKKEKVTEVKKHDFSSMLCSSTIDRVENNSSGQNRRARIYFKNGHELSVISGLTSFGGDEGLFEIMPSDESFFDEGEGDYVLGYLTAERVEYYINKIGRL